MTNSSYDAHRESIAGRADVEDTPELLAYYRDLQRLKTAALWTVANKIEPWQPKSASVPVLWRYRDLREHVLRSVSLVTPEKAGRRVIYLDNPGRRDVAAAVGWLYSGLQVMHPGEAASAHAHSTSALRFIMEGRGAYTIVDGHKMTLEANDFVLTPNGTWHEHGVEADGLPCIWQDGLDIPLVNALEAGFFVVHPDLHQAVAHPVDDSVRVVGRARFAAAPGGLEQAVLAAVQVPVGADLRGAADAGRGQRRQPLRRGADALHQSDQRRARHGDDRGEHAAAAPGFSQPGASPYRQLPVPGGQGQRLLDHRRTALRLAGTRHLLRAVVGLARTCQRVATARTPACSASATCR